MQAVDPGTVRVAQLFVFTRKRTGRTGAGGIPRVPAQVEAFPSDPADDSGRLEAGAGPAARFVLKKQPAAGAAAISHMTATRSTTSSGIGVSTPRRKAKQETRSLPRRSAHSQARGRTSAISRSIEGSPSRHLKRPGETPDHREPRIFDTALEILQLGIPDAGETASIETAHFDVGDSPCRSQLHGAGGGRGDLVGEYG